MTHLLILAGSGEARSLVPRLTGRDGLRMTVSYYENPQIAPSDSVSLRVGGFGGEAAFRAFLRDQRIDAVLDATHPFAARITERTARICAQIGMPHRYLLRPAWVPEAGDRWTMVADASAAAHEMAPGQRVFVGSGRGTLAPLAGTGARITCRRLSPPEEPFPFDGGEFLFGVPPFSVEQERDLFEERGIELLMVKNAGGTASFSKLEAARQLGLPVVMLDRPAPPDCAICETIDEAEAWVKQL